MACLPQFYHALEPLKADLQISTNALDDYLQQKIEAAVAYISDEGITLENTPQDLDLVEMYAAYLYRQRRDNKPMPRSLRWALNNRLFSEKAGDDNG